MTKYTIRIDEQGDDTLDRLKAFLDHDRYIRYLVYREIADITKKVHYQGFVEFPDEYISWHTGRWSLRFKDFPKGKKSSALVKKDNYMIYITKDKDLVLSKGCTEDFINTLETQSYHKVPQVIKKDYYQMFFEYIKQQPEVDQRKYKIQWIAETLVDYMGLEHREIKNFNYYKSLCLNVQSRLIYGSKTEESSNIRSKLADRILNS